MDEKKLERAKALVGQIKKRELVCDILKRCIKLPNDFQCRVSAWATPKGEREWLFDYAIIDKELLSVLLLRAEKKLNLLKETFDKL